MKRCAGIAGLGLIGASMAKALKANTDYRVFGFDILDGVSSLAIEQGVIDAVLDEKSLASCDIIIVALYPSDVIAYCKENWRYMKKGAVVVDCAGVKTRVCKELSAESKNHSIRFVGGHPMAGVERSGFSNSFAGLFSGATMILCEDGFTEKSALDELRSFFLSLGFGSIKITTAALHDEIISYTSQLAHIVSSAYVKSGAIERRYGFSAGSFKDLSRVAKLNENMWTSLFFENRENLLAETDAFIAAMRKYREALASSDFDGMKKLLKDGSERKIADEEKEKKWTEK